MSKSPSGLGAGVEPALDAGAVAAVHDAEDLPGVGVDERAHPRLDPLPATGVVAEEPGTSEPVLIHPQMPYPQGVDLRQLDHRGIERVLHGPPRHPSLAATSSTARPESSTASARCSRSRERSPSVVDHRVDKEPKCYSDRPGSVTDELRNESVAELHL
jgi:hypothetical protein